VFVLSSGLIDTDPKIFQEALLTVCGDLAEQMVRDAEGASRFVRIQVAGAQDEDTAAELGRAVASSVLWRSAVHGGDPNWGRILSALGSCDRSLDLEKVSLHIGGQVVFAAGAPQNSMGGAAEAMAGDDIEVLCAVGSGIGEAEILTTDLSPDYVTLNAGGLT
jgi:glutamate N-acetyltransferase/amino-acid N-acetyltransferase